MDTPIETGAQGFLLTRHWRDTDAGVDVEFWLATPQGARRVRLAAQPAIAFIPRARAARPTASLNRAHSAGFTPLCATAAESSGSSPRARTTLAALSGGIW